MSTEGKTQALKLRLIVAGLTARSRLAIETSNRIFRERPAGHVNLEVIDIYQQPELAQQDRVVAAVPTLIRLLPLPIRRFTGDFSEEQPILECLGIAALLSREQ